MVSKNKYFENTNMDNINDEHRNKYIILIITATEIETREVLTAFSVNSENCRIFLERPYFLLFDDQYFQVFLTQTTMMGIAVAGGSLVTASQAINELKPSSIIMCGIACGTNRKKQKIGDVLISEKISYYEPEKDDAILGKISRGEKIIASEKLIDLFRTGLISENEIRYNFGLILSGEKLINNLGFINLLMSAEPEAIGIEMEAAGIYVAARTYNVDWIIIKGICDFGDGKKHDTYQQKAAKNAASIIAKTLQIKMSTQSLKDRNNSGLPSEQLTQAIIEWINEISKDEYSYNFDEIEARQSAKYLVSREDELEIISELHSQIETDKRPGILLIEGDFGTGKTALIGNYINQIAPIEKIAKHTVVWSRCDENHELEDWYPIKLLFHRIVSLARRNGKFSSYELANILLTNAIAWLKYSTENISTYLQTNSFTPDEVNRQFINLLNYLLTQSTNFVIIIDDLQWADISTINFIRRLFIDFHSQPLFLITMYRPEGLTKGMSPENLRNLLTDLHLLNNIHLRKITLKQGIDINNYMRKRYSRDILSKDIITKIQGFSDGHAQFVDQLFNYWEKDTQLIKKDNKGEYFIHLEPNEELIIPETIDNILEHRVNRMKEGYKDILRKASIEGEKFTVQILAKLISQNPDELIPKLEEINKQFRLISEPQVSNNYTDNFTSPFDIYQFLHSYFREYFYKGLGTSKRIELHRSVAILLEEMTRSNPKYSGKIAYHFAESNEAKKVLEYSLIAAYEARKANAFNEAIILCQQISRTFRNPCNSNLWNELPYKQIYLEGLLIWEDCAEYVEITDDLEKDLQFGYSIIKENKNQEIIYGKICLAIGRIYKLNGYQNGIPIIEEAIKIFEEHNDTNSLYLAKITLADLLIDNKNKFQDGINIWYELIESSIISKDLEKQIQCYSSLGWAYTYTGEYRQALFFTTKALEISNSLTYKHNCHHAEALRMVGYSNYKTGRFLQAEQYQLQSLQQFLIIGDEFSEYWVRFELALTYLCLQQFNQSKEEFNKCLFYAVKSKNFSFELWIRLQLSKLFMVENDLPSAENELFKAKELSAKYDQTPEDKYTLKLTEIETLLRKGQSTNGFTIITELDNDLSDNYSIIMDIQLKCYESRLYIATGNYYKAIKLLRKTERLCKKINETIPSLFTEYILYKCYMEENKPAEARRYYDMVLKTSSSIEPIWDFDIVEKMIQILFL